MQPLSCLPLLSPPRLGAEENGKKEAETGGLGWGQFNRTANKGNSNNNDTDKENTQNKTAERTELLSSPAAVRSRAVTAFPLLSSPTPEPSMTAHGMEYPALFGQSAWLCPFMDSSEN